jgi:hypothetical protein
MSATPPVEFRQVGWDRTVGARRLWAARALIGLFFLAVVGSNPETYSRLPGLLGGAVAVFCVHLAILYFLSSPGD